jgi:hypothetical protein
MQKTIPAHLVSTYQLLQCAFPEGIEQHEYAPLLFILYEEMSDRSLAQAVAEFMEREYHAVLNDVCRVASAQALTSEIEVLDHVKQKLSRCDYEKWLLES